jgi:hypothetical protein
MGIIAWIASKTAVLLVACHLLTRPPPPSRQPDSPLGNV